MALSRWALLLGLLVIMITTSLFGGHFGFTVGGVPHGQQVSGNQPGVLGVVEWVWESITFLFYMVTFQIDNMPVFISAIFLLMSLMTLALIIWLIRGGG